MLILACRDYYCLIRPDWMLVTILRIFPAYLSCVVILAALAAGGYYVLEIWQLDLLHFGLAGLAFCLFQTYLSIYAMRAIGLLFRHYQHKMPIELK